MFPTQRGREKAAPPPPPPSIRGRRSGAKGNRATVRVLLCARSNGRAPVYQQQRYSHPDGVALAAELISGPFHRLTLSACLFLVTQEMFSSQSPPPNRAKQLTELIKFSPAKRNTALTVRPTRASRTSAHRSAHLLQI